MAQWNIRHPRVPWVRFEGDSIKPFHLPGLLWSSKSCATLLKGKNQIVAQEMGMWERFGSRLALTSRFPPGASFLGDPKFPTAFHTPTCFGWWTSCGLISLADLQHENGLISFSQLRAMRDIPLREYYRYLQVRHFFQTHCVAVPSDTNTAFETLCSTSPRQKGLISILYGSMGEVEVILF